MTQLIPFALLALFLTGMLWSAAQLVGRAIEREVDRKLTERFRRIR